MLCLLACLVLSECSAGLLLAVCICMLARPAALGNCCADVYMHVLSRAHGYAFVDAHLYACGWSMLVRTSDCMCSAFPILECSFVFVCLCARRWHSSPTISEQPSVSNERHPPNDVCMLLVMPIDTASHDGGDCGGDLLCTGQTFDIFPNALPLNKTNNKQPSVHGPSP